MRDIVNTIILKEKCNVYILYGDDHLEEFDPNPRTNLVATLVLG